MSESLTEMSAQLADIEATNLGTLEERGMTIIEYGPEFFEEVLALPGVQQLYPTSTSRPTAWPRSCRTSWPPLRADRGPVTQRNIP